MYMQDGSHFGQFSNGQASGFQISFEIRTICTATSSYPMEIWALLYIINGTEKVPKRSLLL